MKKFNKDELFCKKCVVHDAFFKGGGSYISDNCPECGGIECIMYENLSFLQKSKARDKFDRMWKIKWDIK